jgi:hypothetical protein
MRDWQRFAVGIAAVLLLAEATLRVLPVSTGLSYQPSRADDPIVRGKPYRDYVYSTGWNLRLARREHLNNFGYPADEDYDPGVANITVVGDSYIEGLALAPEERFQTALEEQLRRPIRVYGLGRSGSGPAQKLAVAQWAFSTFHPQSVVINLSEGDMSSLAASPGDFHFSLEEGQCRLVGSDRPRDGVFLRLIKHAALYNYLFYNLKVQATLAAMIHQGTVHTGATHAPTGSTFEPLIAKCFMDLLPQTVPLPANRVVFIIGSNLDGVYERHESRKSDMNALSIALGQHGYGVVQTDQIFRADYRQFALPLSFRPTDDHWNARAERLVAGEVANRLGTVLDGAEKLNEGAASRSE